MQIRNGFASSLPTAIFSSRTGVGNTDVSKYQPRPAKTSMDCSTEYPSKKKKNKKKKKKTNKKKKKTKNKKKENTKNKNKKKKTKKKKNTITIKKKQKIK